MARIGSRLVDMTLVLTGSTFSVPTVASFGDLPGSDREIQS
jgi:hypothetical protein